MKVAGKSFSVVGMGRSGLAAARLLARLGGDVVLSDQRDDEELREKKKALGPEIQVVLGSEVIRPGDTVVLSPGISPSAPAFREAYRVGEEVMGEVELFYRLWPGKIVAVTGTDGKSTVTMLIAHLLRQAGLRAYAAGNLGNPLCDLIMSNNINQDDIAVAEVSCFQLVTTSRFRPFVAVVTNISEDHLDWHGSFHAYVRAKARIVANQAKGDWFVRNRDDPVLGSWLREGNSEVPDNGQSVLEVSRNAQVMDGAWSFGSMLHLAIKGQSVAIIRRSNFQPIGLHNVENALLAMAATIPFRVSSDDLERGLRSFRGLPHRIEYVRTVRGIRFYNDSKATNPHAAAAALAAFEEPVVLIAGGYEKGLALKPLLEQVRARCAAVVLCGANAQLMAEQMRGLTKVVVAQDLEEAVENALNLALENDVRVVLFSPATSSYDRYHSYEERGEHFRRIVNGMAVGPQSGSG